MTTNPRRLHHTSDSTGGDAGRHSETVVRSRCHVGDDALGGRRDMSLLGVDCNAVCNIAGRRHARANGSVYPGHSAWRHSDLSRAPWDGFCSAPDNVHACGIVLGTFPLAVPGIVLDRAPAPWSSVLVVAVAGGAHGICFDKSRQGAGGCHTEHRPAGSGVVRRGWVGPGMCRQRPPRLHQGWRQALRY